MTPSSASEAAKSDPDTVNYLDKIFQSAREVESPQCGLIEGHVPLWLRGKYMRIGPGKFDFGSTTTTTEFTVNNFLDGMAILCGFEFKTDGKVELMMRYLKTDAYRKSLEAGRPVYPETHTPCSADPSRSFFKKFIPTLVPEMSDNVSHNLFHLGAQLFASNETNNFWSIDPENLTVLTKYDSYKLFRLNQITAHPICDPKSGEIFIWGCAMTATGGSKYNVMKLRSKNKTDGIEDCAKNSCELLCSISPWSLKLTSFVHTCGLTANYFVLIEQPFFTNLAKVAKSAVFSKSFSCADWLECAMDQVSNRFYIVDRNSGANYCDTLGIYSDEPFVFSHMINTFETDDAIVIDAVVYNSPQVFSESSLNLRSLRRDGLSNLKDPAIGKRFMIPKAGILGQSEGSNMQENVNLLEPGNDWKGLAAFKVNSKIIITGQSFTKGGVEMPKINPNHAGKKYKFLYATGGLFSNSSYANSVFKLNVETRKVRIHRDKHCIFGEPCFVPKGSLASEDSGVVITNVNNVKDGSNYLLLLEGRKFKVVAKILFDAHIPPAMHGLFIAKNEENNIQK